MLRKQVFSAEQLEAIARDYHDAGLEPQEAAILEFAEKVTLHSHAVSQKDVDALRGHGLSDEEILDITLACAARNFWSKTVDSLGTETDMNYLGLEPNVFRSWS